MSRPARAAPSSSALDVQAASLAGATTRSGGPRAAVQLLAIGQAAGNRAARNWLVAQRLADDSDIVQEAEAEGTAGPEEAPTGQAAPVPAARVLGLDAQVGQDVDPSMATDSTTVASDLDSVPESAAGPALEGNAAVVAPAEAGPVSASEEPGTPSAGGLGLETLPEEIADAAASMEETLDGDDDGEDGGEGDPDGGGDAGASDGEGAGAPDEAGGGDSGGADGGDSDAGGADLSPAALAEDDEWATAADAAPLIAEAVEPIALDLDGEQHTVDLEVEGGRLEPVLHTTRSTLTAIRAELAAAVGRGAIAAINAAATAAFATVDARDATLTAAETALDGRRAERDYARGVLVRAGDARDAARAAVAAARDRGRGGAGAGGGRAGRHRSRSRDGRRDRSRSPGARGGGGRGRRAISPEAALEDANDEYRDARSAMRDASDAFHTARVNATVAAGNYETAAATAINVAWLHHRAHLRLHLMPAGAMFQDQLVAGGLTLADYHAGTAGDPIPIVWYKAPTDYPSITQNDGTVVPYPGPADIDGGAPLNVTAGNRLAVGSLVTKVAHNDARVTQQAINDRINASGVQVADAVHGTNVNPMSAAGAFDGDHVTDLGFDGADHIDNYWPLDATVNRRAFNGYNSGYLLHYLRAGAIAKRAIGGLIGKVFRIKGFMARADGDVPNESNTAAAGRN